MDPVTAEFLRAEYEAAWAHIRDIDNRRLRFIEFYISLNAIMSTGVVAIVTLNERVFTIGNSVLILVAALIATGGGLAIRGMLSSERAANRKYRMRANYIRGTFLQGSEDPRIIEYLNRSGTLNTPTDKNEQIDGRGKTLKYVFAVITGAIICWSGVTVAMFTVALTLR